MKLVGIIKELESLCRLVIPKEFRETYGIKDKIELIPTEEGILIRSPKYKLVKKESTEN